MPNINLDVIVSNKTNINGFHMVFRGVGVPTELLPNGTEQGQIVHPQGEQHHLEWSMTGEPGGTMKVEVKQGAAVVKVRNASTIPNSVPVGYDRLKIDL